MPRITGITMSDSPATALAVDLMEVGVRFAAPGGETVALDGLDLAIAPGSFTVVIGPNGSGKSTVLRLIAGLVEPSVGAVHISGSAPRAGDGRVGIAFQQPRLLPWRSILDNVTLPLELAGVPEVERRVRGEEALARVGLADAAGLRPREVSGGMAQRAGLARALIGDPGVLLLDEPFSALDALTREGFDLELQRLWLERRQTVVLVTHSVPEAVTLADRVVVLSPRPGRVDRLVEIDLPRPRSTGVDADAHGAAAALEIRAALDASAAEVRSWSAAEGVA
jgi:NitT/TauT family transport system ATP-binding protein